MLLQPLRLVVAELVALLLFQTGLRLGQVVDKHQLRALVDFGNVQFELLDLIRQQLHLGAGLLRLAALKVEGLPHLQSQVSVVACLHFGCLQRFVQQLAQLSVVFVAEPSDALLERVLLVFVRGCLLLEGGVC